MHKNIQLLGNISMLIFVVLGIYALQNGMQFYGTALLVIAFILLCQTKAVGRIAYAIWYATVARIMCYLAKYLKDKEVL